jgi:DNA-binding NtrC family response regulator
MKLLLIDDDQDSLNMLTNALELFGYDCKAFINPEDGLCSFVTEHFDVVITDYKMPVLSGIDVLRIINEMSPDVDVLIYTAYIHEEIYREAIERGAKGFYIKPIDWSNLINKLDQIRKNMNLMKKN